MEAIIATILPYIAPSALPVVLVVLGGLYIQSKRKETAEVRDKDSKELHDGILIAQNEIQHIKEEQAELKSTQKDMTEVQSEFGKAVARFSVAVDTLTKTVDELKEEVRDMRNK